MNTDLRKNIYSIAKGLEDPTEVYYMDSLPEAIYPFIVFFDVTNVDDRDTGSKYQKLYLQFSAYDIYPTPERVEKITGDLFTALNDKESSFDIPGYKVINVKRMFTRTGKNSQGEWNFISQYYIELGSI